MKQFSKILIANRGEIAVRIIRAAQKSGIRSVAVYAADDAESLHVSLADEAVLLSGDTLAETYLNQEKLIGLALKSGAAAIHPGYGFLAENAGFAQKVQDAGMIFIGPTPENIRLMGEKNRALAYVESLGIPILKSFRGSKDKLLKRVSDMEFPVMVKASGGGGGRGMLICNSPEELPEALQNAERQAFSYFGNGDLFVEKYLPRARHIEVQLMADTFGNVLHFFERECSVQRRFQKIMEEAPSPSVTPELREKLTSAAVKIARSMSYRNAGTIEYLLDEDGQFYFLEMNTRIQVEHPVTEMVTNTDLISLQLLVAAGNRLGLKQADIQLTGHAVEVRLCAEDAENQFHPSAGKLALCRFPEQQNFRLETFIQPGITISPGYDSLLAKLITVSESREEAIRRLQKVLGEVAISGVHTNLSFLNALLESEVVVQNKIYTRYIDENLDVVNLAVQERKVRINPEKIALAYLIFHFYPETVAGSSVWKQIGFWRINHRFEVWIDGVRTDCFALPLAGGLSARIGQTEYRISGIRKSESLVEVAIDGQNEEFYCVEKEKETRIISRGSEFQVRSNALPGQAAVFRNNLNYETVFQNLIRADLFGKVLHVNATVGEAVSKGQTLLTLESMKTEIHVLSPTQARIKKIHVKTGETVAEKQVLIELEAQAPSSSPKGGE